MRGEAWRISRFYDCEEAPCPNFSVGECHSMPRILGNAYADSIPAAAPGVNDRREGRATGPRPARSRKATNEPKGFPTQITAARSFTKARPLPPATNEANPGSRE